MKKVFGFLKTSAIAITAMALIMYLLFLPAKCSGNIDHYVFTTEVDAVYMHTVNSYSYSYEDEGRIITSRFPKYAPITLYRDVAPGDPMWVTCDYTYNSWHTVGSTGGCEIHVRSINDIGTAGWSRGKFGSGTTTRIN